MDDKIKWLITLLQEGPNVLSKCALQVPREKLTGDIERYPMEPENRKYIHSLLPIHVQSLGPIVDIEKIFEIYESKEN